MPARQPNPNSHARSDGTVFAINERLNQLLLEHLDSAAWNAKPPGSVRTIAAIFTHMHNVRAKWIRLTAPHLEIPSLLNRAHCTPRQAQKAFAQSGMVCEQMLAGVESGHIQKFLRDGWARAWLASPGLPARMLCYMVAHEAHHRGQIAMLAHQLGHPLSGAVTSKLWNW
jgi:uncharacterized damage-inducible protein DinB